MAEDERLHGRGKRANYGQKAAVALKYNPDLNYAPVVVASGLGHMAQKIVNIADENGVPIYRDDSAAALLVMLGSGEQVPKELYGIIAAVYAEVLSDADKLKKNDYSEVGKAKHVKK